MRGYPPPDIDSDGYELWMAEEGSVVSNTYLLNEAEKKMQEELMKLTDQELLDESRIPRPFDPKINSARVFANEFERRDIR